MAYSFITDALPEAKELALFSQPVRGVYRNDADYSEVLSRVAYRDGSINPPGDLITALKKQGWMNLMDRSVIRNVITLASLTHESTCYGVNISAESVATNGCFFKFVVDELQWSGVHPGRIVIEINENVLVSGNPVILESILKLKSMGCKIALDDFGSGWLNFLDIRSVAPDYLKLANPFVAEIKTEFSSGVVAAICKLCKSLGILSVAECVEDQNTFAALENLGIDLMQGWYIGAPTPVRQLNFIGNEQSCQIG